MNKITENFFHLKKKRNKKQFCDSPHINHNPIKPRLKWMSTKSLNEWGFAFCFHESSESFDVCWALLLRAPCSFITLSFHRSQACDCSAQPWLTGGGGKASWSTWSKVRKMTQVKVSPEEDDRQARGFSSWTACPCWLQGCWSKWSKAIGKDFYPHFCLLALALGRTTLWNLKQQQQQQWNSSLWNSIFSQKWGLWSMAPFTCM